MPRHARSRVRRAGWDLRVAVVDHKQLPVPYLYILPLSHTAMEGLQQLLSGGGGGMGRGPPPDMTVVDK